MSSSNVQIALQRKEYKHLEKQQQTTSLILGSTGTGESLNLPILVDAEGNLKVTAAIGAASLGKAVDSAAGATDTGVAMLAVRSDALTTITPSNGDYTTLRVDNFGRLWTRGTYVEDTAHVTGDAGTQVLAVRNDTLAALADADGDYTPLQVNASGALYVESTNLATGAATETLQGTINTSIGTVNTSVGVVSAKLPATLGQKAMASSMAVVVSNDQSAISVDVSASQTKATATATITGGTITQGTTSATIDLGDGSVTTKDKYNRIQINGSSVTSTFSFVLQFSENSSVWNGSDGLEPTLMELDTGVYHFSLTRTEILSRYVRLFYTGGGSTVIMNYTISK